MDKPPIIRRNQVFHGTLGDALRAYVNHDEKKLVGEFWHTDAIATVVENADNAMKSLRVLRKHLPKQFQPLIRFAQPKATWYLNVEKGVTANQLNMLLDDLLVRIARDIGYAPRLQIAVQPSHLRWSQSGFPLLFPEQIKIPRPDEAKAQEIIDAFIAKDSVAKQ